MRRVALATGLLLLTTACGQPKFDMQNLVDPVSGAEKTTDETDTTQCQFGTPPKSLNGTRWQLFLRGKEIRYTMLIEFSDSRIWLSNTCHYANQSVTAYVSSFVSEASPGVLKIETSEQKTATGNDGFGSKATCSASIQKGLLRYGFSGSCLQLQGDSAGTVTTLLPAR